jgi:tRNA splicing endonuclease
MQEPSMNPLELDQEIGKMARAMMTRNRQIGAALIAHLRTQMTIECVAGVLLVSIQRLLWLDTESVIWTIENLIPADVMQEIVRIRSVTVYKHLIAKGFVPGQDMSVDALGKLLVKQKARAAVR